MERRYKPEPRPKNEPAENRPRGFVGKGTEDNEMNTANLVDLKDSDIGSDSHKKQALKYYEGKSKGGKNLPFFPEQAGHSNDLGEVIDLGRKRPYGDKSRKWSENEGKLGDLDPQETDQPSWVNTWSACNTGPGGAGVTQDENYGALRPRTFSRQHERFEALNPEFQEGAGDGDWTSAKFDENI